jgi:hypothetical protein
MASNINPNNIDGTYPIQGENNDSQGFRTNFTNTSTNLSLAKAEIEDLQAKAILKSSLTGGGAVDNTLTVPIKTAASTTTEAGLSIAEGIAPTSPIDGDVWVTAAGEFFARLNGADVDLATGGSALTVEDDGTPLSTEATKINFVGFTVTEPVANEITVTAAGGGAALTSEYCPGYTYVFVNTTRWQITGFDVSNLFSVSRRLKFTDGASTYYGTISAVDYNGISAGNTTIDMTMEGGDVLTNSITEVCLTTGVAGWSPIAGDPFGGTSINDITTGLIGTTQWWVAAGDGGKFGVSNDKGVTWTLLSTATTENLNVCAYDSDNQRFWAGGNLGVLVTTTDCITASTDTVSLPAIATTGNADVYGMDYQEQTSALILDFRRSTSIDPLWTQDQGSTWFLSTSLSSGIGLRKQLKCNQLNASQRGDDHHHIIQSSSSVWYFTSIGDTTSTQKSAVAGGTAVTAMGLFFDGANAEVYGGIGGVIGGSTGWTGDDNVTFSSAIRDFAYSSIHERLVCVGDSGILGYWDRANKSSTNAWIPISHGFDPLTNIHAVTWNGTDGVFIAVAANGQIARSTNGTN